MNKMYDLNTIDRKYIDLSKEYGIKLDIQHIDDSNMPAQYVEENNNKATIKLNLSKINNTDYEIYLSYNIRKILLPKLRVETERLIIRNFDLKDSDTLFEFFSDKDSCYFDGGYEPYVGKNSDYYGLMADFANDKTRYVVVQKDTDEVIGMIHLTIHNDRAVEVMEIGYTINPSKRRNGYAMEATKAMVNYLLNTLNLDMIIAGILEENVISLRMIEKLGFTFEGRKRKALYHQVHGPSDLLYFYIERI